MITVYTLPVCPNCDDFKTILFQNNIDFIVKDLEDDENRIELLMDCVTLIEAPIIKIGNNYYNKDDAMKELKLW